MSNEKKKRNQVVSKKLGITNRRVNYDEKGNVVNYPTEDFEIIHEGQEIEPNENTTYEHHIDAQRTRAVGEK